MGAVLLLRHAGILLIYLCYSAADGGLGISERTATGIVGAYGGLVYLRRAGAFDALWTKLGSRQPSTPIKFAAGTAIMGVAFLMFLPMAGDGANSAPLLGLVAILFVFTVAELLLSPVGLSVSTKLAPELFRTQMVALFFSPVALGTALSGTLAGYYSAEDETAYFGILGMTAIVIGALLALISKPVRKLMGGVG